MEKVHVYTINVNEERAIGIDGLDLSRVPVIGDKLIIRQKERGEEVANIYKVVDVHLENGGRADVVVSLIGEYNDYMATLVSRPL